MLIGAKGLKGVAQESSFMGKEGSGTRIFKGLTEEDLALIKEAKQEWPKRQMKNQVKRSRRKMTKEGGRKIRRSQASSAFKRAVNEKCQIFR